MRVHVYAKSLQLCLILCDPKDCIACQAPLSMEFSRQGYWRGLPRSPLGDSPNPGMEPKRHLLCLLHWQLGSLPLASPGSDSLRNQFCHFSRLVVPDSLQPHELQHARLSCPSPLQELAQTHIHRVSDANQPFQPLSSSSSPAFPSIRVSSNESVLHIRWPKYWSFSFSISPSNEYLGFPLGLTGLISFHGLWNNHVYFLRKTCYKFLFFPKPVFSNFISPGGHECLN